MTRKEALLHARLPVYRNQVAAAHEIVREALSLCRSPFVAFSCGKDSAVLLHLVMQHSHDIEARFIRWPETNLLSNYDAVIDDWKVRFGMHVQILDMTRDSLDDRVSGRWCVLQGASDAVFNGMRADESRMRRIALSKRGPIYRRADGVLRVCPLARMTTADVAAYIETNELPTLNAYIENGYEARTTSRIPRADYGIRENMLARLRVNNPPAYAALKQIYEEI